MESTRRRCLGLSTTGFVLVLLLVAAAAGAWNYRRNLAAEQASRAERSLGGYTDEDLVALADAYRAQVQRAERAWSRASKSRVETTERDFFGDQIDEYERVRRESAARREVGAQASVEKAALAAVEEELALRQAEQGGAMQVFWRRLTRF